MHVFVQSCSDLIINLLRVLCDILFMTVNLKGASPCTYFMSFAFYKSPTTTTRLLIC